MSTKQFVATTAVTESGIVCYMKTFDGRVIAEYNNITNAQVQAAESSNDLVVIQELKQWYRSPNIYCTCDPNSNLAAYAMGDKVAIFHVYEGKLCYWLHEPFNPAALCSDANRVQLPDPASPDMQPLSGTHLAVTGDSKGQSIVLIYQAQNNNLYCRNAQSLTWTNVETILPAVAGTGLAAVSWDGTNNIRVYYQDSSFAVTEYCRINDKWTQGSPISTDSKALTSIGVAQWINAQGGIELRVYFQVGGSTIKEKGYTQSGAWYGPGTIMDAAFAATFSVLTFCRGTVSSPVINVWIVSEDGRVLLQEAFNAGHGWQGPVATALPRSDYADTA